MGEFFRLFPEDYYSDQMIKAYASPKPLGDVMTFQKVVNTVKPLFVISNHDKYFISGSTEEDFRHCGHGKEIKGQVFYWCSYDSFPKRFDILAKHTLQRKGYGTGNIC